MRRPLIILTFAALGCSGAGSPRAASPSPRREPAADASTPEVANVMRVGGDDATYVNVREVTPREGTLRRYLVDGSPVEIDGDAVRVADGMLGEGGWRALRAADGWRFVSERGVWTAPSFLGPRRMVMSTHDGVVGPGVGRVVTVRDGRVVGMTLPPSAVIDAAFADDARGIAVIEPGVALVTADGGLRWTLAPPLGEIVREVAADVEGLWSIGASRALLLRSDGTSGAVDVAAAPRTAALPDRDEGYRIMGRVDRPGALYVAHFLDLTESIAVATVRTSNATRQVIYDLVDDRIVGPFAPPPGCDGQGQYLTADRLYAICPRGARAALLGRSDDGTWVERLAFNPCAAPPRCAVSNDGQRVACEGRCSATDACGPGANLCEQMDGAAPRSRVVEGRVPSWSIAGWDGDELVLLDARRFLSHAMTIRGADPPVPLMANDDRSRYRLLDDPARLGRDGLLRVRAARVDNGDVVVFEGRPGERFALRELPAWMTASSVFESLRLCSSEGDLAATDSDGMVWFSTHLDREWRPLTAVLSDPYLTLRIPETMRAQDHVTCSSVGWHHGLLANGWGRPVPTRYGSQGLRRDEVQPEPFPAPWTCSRDDRQPRPDNEGEREDDRLPGSEYASEDWSWNAGRFWVREDPPRVPRRVSYAFPWRPGSSGILRPRPSLVETRGLRAVVLAPVNDASGATVLAELSTAGPPRVFWRSTGAQESFRPELTARDGPVFVTWLSGFLSSRGGGDSQTVIVAREGHGTLASSVRASPSATGAVGVYAVGADAGFLRVLPDGTVLGSGFDGLPHVLATRVTLDPCGAGARGDFVIRGNLLVVLEQGQGFGARPEMHLSREGDALCLRHFSDQAAWLLRDAQGVSGRYGSVAQRCAPPARD